MKLKTHLFGKTYQFRDVKEVLAKANEPRSGDMLAGVAAQSAQERVAAKQVLSELTLADLRENPVIPYEEDCVTRVIQDDSTRPPTPASATGAWASCARRCWATTPTPRRWTSCARD